MADEDFWAWYNGEAFAKPLATERASSYGPPQTATTPPLAKGQERLLPNVGTPQVGTITPQQVSTIGVGLGNAVNALGYRVTEPNALAAVPAPAAAVNALAGNSIPLATRPAPAWIAPPAQPSPPPPVTFAGTHTGKNYIAGKTYTAADGHQAVANADGSFSRITSDGTTRPRPSRTYDADTNSWN